MNYFTTEKQRLEQIIETRKRLKIRAEEARTKGLVELFSDLTAAQFVIKELVNKEYGEFDNALKRAKPQYKGYTAEIELDADEKVFYGKVASISDLIMFEGDTYEKLITCFHTAIDEYLEHCIRNGREPKTPPYTTEDPK